MENASKALIIAGAILISILLISVGILVMNSTTNVQDQMQQQMDSTAIQTFNASVSGYAGMGRSSSQVKSLINTIVSSNAATSNALNVTITWDASDATRGTLPSISKTGDAALISSANTYISSKHKYNITITSETGDDGVNSGLLNTIVITEV